MSRSIARGLASAALAGALALGGAGALAAAQASLDAGEAHAAQAGS